MENIESFEDPFDSECDTSDSNLIEIGCKVFSTSMVNLTKKSFI